MDALLPTLYFGFPIVGTRGRFAPDRAFELMQRYGVTNAFLFPTALKMMMSRSTHHAAAYSSPALDDECPAKPWVRRVFDWVPRALGVTVNEMFGQTEMNYIVAIRHEKVARTPGQHGATLPGASALRSSTRNGEPVPAGATGEVALHRRDIHGHADPVFFLEYWRNPKRHAASSAATGAARATSPASTPTAISGTRDAPTTCSRRRATGSGRARSRIA